MATSKYTDFRNRMHALLATDELLARADTLTTAYWKPGSYTGPHFDQLHDSEHPDEITERDLVAVSMLSVTIPPWVEIWVLSDEGRAQVGRLLEPVPLDADLRTHGRLLDAGGHLDQLWSLLRSVGKPGHDEANGMGTTKTSKLLAASALVSSRSTTRSSGSCSAPSTTTGMPTVTRSMTRA